MYSRLQIPMEHPELPSLDELASAVPDGLPDNATFPITETPPHGHMTDENEHVSPSSSAGIHSPGGPIVTSASPGNQYSIIGLSNISQIFNLAIGGNRDGDNPC